MKKHVLTANGAVLGNDYPTWEAANEVATHLTNHGGDPRVSYEARTLTARQVEARRS